MPRVICMRATRSTAPAFRPCPRQSRGQSPCPWDLRRPPTIRRGGRFQPWPWTRGRRCQSAGGLSSALHRRPFPRWHEWECWPPRSRPDFEVAAVIGEHDFVARVDADKSIRGRKKAVQLLQFLPGKRVYLPAIGGIFSSCFQIAPDFAFTHFKGKSVSHPRLDFSHKTSHPEQAVCRVAVIPLVREIEY